MKKLWAFLFVGMLSAGFTAYAEEQAASAEKPGAVASRLSVITATIEAIDYDNRLVTLKGQEGDSVTLKVDQRARNLQQAKVGDTVEAEFYESVALFVQKAGSATPATAEIAAVELAPLGEKPGIASVDTRLITASVEAIDYDSRMVTLKGPEGNTLKLKVDERAQDMDKVKVGDQVVARYTQAIAISVKTPAK